jgi:hypothetical protein
MGVWKSPGYFIALHSHISMSQQTAGILSLSAILLALLIAD